MEEVSFPQWLILKEISLLEYNKEMMIAELKERIRVSDTDPYFYQILNMLLDEEIIIHTRSVKNHRFIKINYKKLDAFIRNTDIFKKVGEWIENKVAGYRY